MRHLLFLREDLDQLLQWINIYRFFKRLLQLPSVDTFNEHLEVLELCFLVLLDSFELFLVFLLLNVELRLGGDLGRRDHRRRLSGFFHFLLELLQVERELVEEVLLLWHSAQHQIRVLGEILKKNLKVLIGEGISEGLEVIFLRLRFRLALGRFNEVVRVRIGLGSSSGRQVDLPLY
jgi:hypothetical protein